MPPLSRLPHSTDMGAQERVECDSQHAQDTAVASTVQGAGEWRQEAFLRSPVPFIKDYGAEEYCTWTLLWPRGPRLTVVSMPATTQVRTTK